MKLSCSPGCGSWFFLRWRKIQVLVVFHFPMFLTVSSNSRALWAAPLALAVLLGCNGRLLSAQTTTQTPAPLSRDLTRPELQPRLDIDHDPIPSPDV